MEGSKFGGQWKVPSLMANGKFQAWWPMKMFQTWWSMEGEGKHLFTSSHFPPNKLYLNLRFFL
jgi:hypothetical protein